VQASFTVNQRFCVHVRMLYSKSTFLCTCPHPLQ